MQSTRINAYRSYCLENWKTTQANAAGYSDSLYLVEWDWMWTYSVVSVRVIGQVEVSDD